MTRARRSPVVLFLLHALYDGLFVGFLLLSAPYFALRAVRDRGLRQSLGGRFGFGPSRMGERPCLWVHGVSVGELKAARLLVEQLAAARPDHDIVVSSTTSAGFALAKRLFPRQLVIQFPLDLRWIVRRVLDRVRPDLIVLIELEIWPNLMQEASRRAIPVAIVNGRVSARSFSGYRLLARLLPQFELIALYAVQNAEYAGRLRALGVPDGQVFVTGNTKFDTLRTELPHELLADARRELGFAVSTPLVVAGSTHAGEEEALLGELAAWRREVPGTRLLLVPRHVERVSEIVRVVERSGFRAARLTELRRTGQVASDDAVVVVDTIGELETFYALASIAFVGGSLGARGGHNMLEPAALGVATIYGPSTENFVDEVRLLTEHRGGEAVADWSELSAAVVRLLRDPIAAKALGARGRHAVAFIRGGTARSCDLLLRLLATGRPARNGARPS
ncbi:MAG: 3-deoxy-D-manno-octulosonic acid transferase [Planctomycetes bacterium]|nr:3-deoxy-D-manno-octulosonic acid transferase [Planctomycetota bacterium]